MSTHLAASDLTDLHQHRQKSYWWCFCGVLIAGYWSFVSGDKTQVRRAAKRETARLRCQRNARPGEAGSSRQSQWDTNFSCGDRVNSGCAKPTLFPSKTSCMYQRFSGNRIKPRRTRESIPHEKPGPREQMGFITVLLSAPDWVDFSTLTGHGWSISCLFQTQQI